MFGEQKSGRIILALVKEAGTKREGASHRVELGLTVKSPSCFVSLTALSESASTIAAVEDANSTRNKT